MHDIKVQYLYDNVATPFLCDKVVHHKEQDPKEKKPHFNKKLFANNIKVVKSGQIPPCF